MRTTTARWLFCALAAVMIVASSCGGDAESVTDQDALPESTAAGSPDGDEVLDTDAGADGSTDADPDDIAAEPESGGTLRIALQTEAPSLNPTKEGLNRGPIMVANAIFDTLVVLDADGNWHNNTTESWTPNDDFTSWEVSIRPGIEFSDGLPYDAVAVVGGIEAFLADPLVSLVFKPVFDAENPVEVVDELTFRLNANGPNASMPLYFSEQLGMIGSPAWLEAAAANPDLDQLPVGAGPFVIESRTQDTETVLVRNDNWWRDDVEVTLDRIEIFPVVEPGTRADQLIAGDVDLTHGTETIMIRPLRGEGDALVRFEDNSGEELFMVMNASKAPFDDIRVRQAATHVFPRADLLEFVIQGVSVPATSLFPPDSVWHDPTIAQLDDMPELAGPLIAEYCAEVPDSCTDGKVDIEYQSGIGIELDLISDIVSDAMSDHFNISLQRMPNDSHVQEVIFGQYDMASWRFHAGTDPDIDSVFLMCDTISVISINFSRNCSEERDALIVAQRMTQDFDERYAIWQEIQQNISDSYQYIIAAHTNWTMATTHGVSGLCDSTTPDGVALPCQRQGVSRLDQVVVVG